MTNSLKNNDIYGFFLSISCIFLCLASPVYSASIEVFVSILPQQYAVERIGGDYVNVNVMVKPGQSPETFEPSPKLMSLYSKSDIFFTIGLPFEQVWIDRVASLNKDILVINTQPDKDSLTDHIEKATVSSEHHHSWDPHTWLSPVLFLQQAKIILHELIAKSPENKSYYYSNYNELKHDINVMHDMFSKAFKETSKANFITFHPAFSYFARQYGLTQISIEMDGKDPSAKQVAQVINRMKKEKVAYLLIEKQFNQTIPVTIANSVGAKILVIDPLALDYLMNMRDVADKIRRALF